MKSEKRITKSNNEKLRAKKQTTKKEKQKAKNEKQTNLYLAFPNEYGRLGLIQIMHSPKVICA